MIRSNIKNIVPGFVYPYNAIRSESKIPEKFQLNQENGIFIGLFLADSGITSTLKTNFFFLSEVV